MSSERVRGALLYTVFGLLLIGGAGWWLRAAPPTGEPPEIAAWRATVERKLPDAPGQADARTVVLPAGSEREELSNVANGSYLVSVICAGESRVRITLSSVGNDSGRGLACGTDPTPFVFTSGVAGQFHLSVNVADAGPVVLRWTLLRLTD